MRQTRAAQSTYNYTKKRHAPRLRKPCISSDLLTPQERLTGVKFGQEIHRDRDFYSLHWVYNGCRYRQLN